jgi:hypothetical protein
VALFLDDVRPDRGHVTADQDEVTADHVHVMHITSE